MQQRRIATPGLLAFLLALPPLGCPAPGGGGSASDSATSDGTATGGTTTDTPGTGSTTGGTTTGGTTTTDSTTGNAATGGVTSDDPCVTGGDCGWTTGFPTYECGNGLVEPGESCDLGAGNDDHAACTSACAPAVCGDGLVFDGVELCDDGNANPDDACPNNCGLMFTYTPPRIVAGEMHTCALSNAGKVRCWGGVDVMLQQYGQLGQGHTDGIGDDPGEMPPADVPLGAAATQIVAGGNHTCALLVGGAVKCWGLGGQGALGLGSPENVGDEPGEMPPPAVALGGPAVQLTAGGAHTCALMASGEVRCWGSNAFHVLGTDGGDDIVGDEPGEMPPPAVSLPPAKVVQIGAGATHTCALLETGGPICWGMIEPGNQKPPHPLGFGGFVVELAHGDRRVCARLYGGQVRCMGLNIAGEAGYGNTQEIDDPLAAGDVPVGGPAKRLITGSHHTCAILESGALRCWGMNSDGLLGYGHTASLGDDPGELPTPDIDLGGAPLDVAAGGSHSCALFQGDKVRCWGTGFFGNLGQGDHENIGDMPGDMPPPDVAVF